MESINTELSKNILTRSKTIHKESIFINALDSTRIAEGDDEYIAKLKQSGVTAINHTVASTAETIEAMRSIVDWWKVYTRYPDDIIIGVSLEDILRAKEENKVAVFLGFRIRILWETKYIFLKFFIN